MKAVKLLKETTVTLSGCGQEGGAVMGVDISHSKDRRPAQGAHESGQAPPASGQKDQLDLQPGSAQQALHEPPLVLSLVTWKMKLPAQENKTVGIVSDDMGTGGAQGEGVCPA